MDQMTVDENDCAAFDEEDWFFPQPSIDVPEDITARYKRVPEPVLPPIIRLSGMDLNCRPVDIEVNLADFESWEEFSEAFSCKYLYISIVDADNCDFDKAQHLLNSEEIFEELLDNYKACL